VTGGSLSQLQVAEVFSDLFCRAFKNSMGTAKIPIHREAGGALKVPAAAFPNVDRM
jgi:hypothetical protein